MRIFHRISAFSLYITNFAGRISEAAMCGAGCAQRPALRDKESKKTGVRNARSRTFGKKPIVYNNFKIYVTIAITEKTAFQSKAFNM
jgi:hypothetical protein